MSGRLTLGVTMPYTMAYNKTAPACACNATRSLTPLVVASEAEMVITHLAAQRDSQSGDRADFCYSAKGRGER